MDDLLNYARRQASSYATNNIMFTMGEDFHYMSGNRETVLCRQVVTYLNFHHGFLLRTLLISPETLISTA